MEDNAECMLVLIGATPEGKKELVGFQIGVRESAQSWRELLIDIKQRGLAIAPDLAVGDGALGFWKAIEPPPVYETAVKKLLPCMALTKAAQYRAYAATSLSATSLANAEAAADKATRDVNLAIAQHFYLLAEDELSRVARLLRGRTNFQPA